MRGFLNFRTTVDGTVIVFTPSSETPQQPPKEAVGANQDDSISRRVIAQLAIVLQHVHAAAVMLNCSFNDLTRDSSTTTTIPPLIPLLRDRVME